MKVLAVGDIHTKQWIIDSVHKIIDKYDAVVFVGDYADDFNVDGIESIETWRTLYMLQQLYPDKVKLVIGNHDYIYIQRTPYLQSGYNGVTQIGIDSPANKYLKDWLLGIPVTLELDGVTYSHAGISEGWDGSLKVLDLWQDLSPLWVRPGWSDYQDIPQVFGHTPQKTCKEVAPGKWCIDTFSTYGNGKPIGDHTVLVVTNGEKFKKVKL